ncbi:MAG: hypothetical protein AAGA63_02365, partial [Pseudomonadota bacterium]
RGEPLEKICAITVANMSSDQGIALIQPWVRLTKGKPSKRLSEKAAAAWTGRLAADVAYTGVIIESIYRPISGAWVRLIVVDR